MSDAIWKGTGIRATDKDFKSAAQALDVEEAVIRAVWQVESAGKPFQADDTLTRRFEPHKLKVPQGNWRTSMKIPTAKREQMFLAAYAKDPEDALRATSWGSAQIMGFNFKAAGYTSARQMVSAFAQGEGEQLRAFIRLIQSWGIATMLRAHNWLGFALRYNGDANGADYASKIEAAYRKRGGKPSPVVISLGSTGPQVVKLQSTLGLNADGSFGPATQQAVMRFQEAHDLRADGIVGAVTWEKLEELSNVKPIVQETKGDRTAAIGEWVALGSTGAGAVATVGAALPESTMNILAIGVMVAALAALVFYGIRRLRVG